MKIKVQNLTGPLILAAYDMAEGATFQVDMPEGQFSRGGVDGGCAEGLWSTRTNSAGQAYTRCHTCAPLEAPKLEDVLPRYRMSVEIKHDGWWIAKIYDINDEPRHITCGASPIEAAMRTAVTSVFGAEVEIPDAVVAYLGGV